MVGAPEGPIRILHVEDEPAFADLCRTYLRRENDQFRIEIATDATDGLGKLEEEDFDCVVSDFDMPGDSGIDLLRDIRSEDTELPFILFTGKGSEEIASEAISAGVTDYLQKGGGTDQYTVLANRIENAVGKLRAESLVQRAFQAMDRSREGIALLDEAGEFIYVNDAYTEIVGYEQDELMGEFWETVYPNDQISRITEEILPRIPEEGYWSGDTVYQRKDGARQLVNHALTYSDEGTMICLVRDLSDAEVAQERRRERRELLDLFIEHVEEYAIVLLDPDGYITSWNTGAEAVTGYGRTEILGNHLSKLYPEEALDDDVPEELCRRARRHESATAEGWRLSAENERFWSEEVVTALSTDDGSHRGYALVIRDMTERRAREESIRQTQEQFDALADVFYVIDLDRKFLRFNDRLVDVTGYSGDTLEDLPVMELIPEDDHERFASEHEQLLDSDEIVTTQSHFVTKDGSQIPYEFRRRRLKDATGEIIGFVGIGRDITERKRTQRELEQHLARMEEFGSVLTHDLRNPLSVAKGHLPFLEDGQNAEHIDAIERSLARIETIIEDVLEMTQTGATVTDPSETDLIALARRMWDDMEKGEINPDIEFVAVDPMMADPSLLERLLMNLFRNSVEHGGEAVTVTVGPLEDGFYVEDDGPGISEERREQVFDWRFTTKEGGSGVGLKSVAQIVEAHGWTIDVTEGTAGGARFEIIDVDFVEQ